MGGWDKGAGWSEVPDGWPDEAGRLLVAGSPLSPDSASLG